jgi:hypothetical protein
MTAYDSAYQWTSCMRGLIPSSGGFVIEGKAKDIKTIAERLIGTKGVKRGKLSSTTVGRHLK